MASDISVKPFPAIVIPRGRSAAEKRLAAVAALHQPAPVFRPIDELCGPTCGQCRSAWPCATARLLGPWPGEAD